MLESIEEIININNLSDIPSDSFIENLPRNKKLILEFSDTIEPKREKLGENLKLKFPKHSIGINLVEPKIGIRKLITDEEIDSNQTLFENYALEYRELATKLIFGLAEKLKIDLKNEIPYFVFVKHWQEKGQSGKYEEWKYFFHGFHCNFYNTKTQQEIEVPIVFGLEFGDLDPYFFSNYIKSTKEYQPLPIQIYEEYSDGLRIIERLTSKGIFEKINSTFPGHFGTVPKNRENKVAIQTLENPMNSIKPKPKFNLLKFLKLKK